MASAVGQAGYPHLECEFSTVIRRLGVLVFGTALSALAPLISVPVVARIFGADGFSALALWQSLGSAGVVLLTYGWNLVGPRDVAAADSAMRGKILATAVVAQTAIAIPTASVLASIGAIMVPQHAAAVSMGVLATCAVGILPTWYFVGTGEAGKYLVLCSVPIVVGTLTGVLLASVWHTLLLIAVAQLLTSLMAIFLALRWELKRWGFPNESRSLRGVVGVLRTQWPYAATQIASIAYINLPISLYAVSSPAGLAIYAAADRLYRLGLVGLGPLTQLFQGWVKGQPSVLHRRMVVAVLVHFGVGCTAWGAFVVFGPTAWRLLFGPEIPLDRQLLLLFGATFVAVLVSRSIGANVLVHWQAGRTLALSSGVAAIIALLGIPAAARVAGPVAVASLILALECTVLLIQLIGVWAALRKMKSHEPASRNVVKELPKF